MTALSVARSRPTLTSFDSLDKTLTLRGFKTCELLQPRVSLLLYHDAGVEAAALPQGAKVVVGRGEPADVVIRDPSLSRRHARFTLEGDQIIVEDLGSTNGTRVNGEPVTSAKIKAGDEVRLGGVVAKVNTMAASLRGVESHDHFLPRLEDEVGRARHFKRRLALLMVGAAEADAAALHIWSPRIQRYLRSVDHVALHRPGTVEILLPESSHQDALALARLVVEAARLDGLRLRCGIATFPEAGGTAAKLVEVCRIALSRATEEQPVASASTAVDPEGWVAPAEEADGEEPLVASVAMREVYDTVERVADTTLPVLIFGETGVGKELVARAIHERGDRRGGPMRCVNCAAIPDQLIESVLFGHERGAFTGAAKQSKGIFEEADGGTVLLDEVGELSPAAQAALLRVLETKRIQRVGSSREIEVDVRVIAATHRDLEAMCDAEAFRWDLYFRLNTMTLTVPPLRDRPEEIAPLALLFLQRAIREQGSPVREIDAAALELLRAHRWPGNVRELKNEIERAAVLARGGAIEPRDLSRRVRPADEGRAEPRRQPPPPTETTARVPRASRDEEALVPEEGVEFKALVQDYEKRLILEALGRTGWNQVAAARLLNMPARTLTNKLRAYDLRNRP